MNWHDSVETVRGNLWIVGGVVGRLIFHGREAQASRRRFWDRELRSELLVAIDMAFVGKAIASGIGLSVEAAAGAVRPISAHIFLLRDFLQHTTNYSRAMIGSSPYCDTEASP